MRYRHRSDTSNGLQPRELAADPTKLQLHVGQPSDGTPTPMLPFVRHSALASYFAGDHVVYGGVTYSAKDDLTPGAFNPDQWNRVTEITPLYFGARCDGSNDRAAIQAAIDYAAQQSANTWTDAAPSGIRVSLRGLSYKLSGSLTFTDQTYSRITICDGQLVIDDAADWGDDGAGNPTRYAIEVTGSNISGLEINDVNIICNRAANGVLLATTNGGHNKITSCEITNYVSFGVRVTAGGDQRIEDNDIAELINSQTDFLTDANYKGIGISVESADNKIFQNIVRWTKTCLKISGGNVIVADNHLYNGGSGLMLRDRPVLVDQTGWGALYTGNYFDNGEIRIYEKNAVFVGNRHAYNSTRATIEGVYCIYATAVDDEFGWLRISTAMIPFPVWSDSAPYIKLVEEDGNNFIERQSSFLLRGTSADVEVFPRSRVFTRVGYDSRRVAEFRGQMSTALVCAESSTSTNNSTLPGFGAFGDEAVISTNNTNNLFVSASGNTGVGASFSTHKFGVQHNNRDIALFKNSASPYATCLVTAQGTRDSFSESVGGFIVRDTNYGDRAAFSGYTVTGDVTGSFAVVGSSTGGVLTERWAVTDTGAWRPWLHNSVDIGTPSFRVKDIYLANSPNVSSDERLKEDIADSDIGLNFISALRPVKFKLIEAENSVESGDVEPQETQEHVTSPEQYQEVDVIDGIPTLTTKTRYVPLYDSEIVVDENGDPVMVDDGEGNLVARTHLVPRMQTVVRDAPTLHTHTNSGERFHYGFIAQEVKAVVDSLELHSFGGWGLSNVYDPNSIQHLRYEELIAPLVKAVQELAARVDSLESQ